jgi:hypothetical protein
MDAVADVLLVACLRTAANSKPGRLAAADWF